MRPPSASGGGASPSAAWTASTTSPGPASRVPIGDDDVERVIVKTLEETPTNATHWSTRSMARATGMSQTAVSRIWRAFGLKPHQLESFRLSTDPLFVEKVRDIVGLYLNPPEAAIVLCVDEKSQIQALDRTAPILPLLPGTPARATHDYRRHGTTNLYAALDVASGLVISDLTERHRAAEFRRFLNLIEHSVPAHTQGPRHRRGLLHAQDARHPSLARASSPLRLPLHAHLQLLAEPRRALVGGEPHPSAGCGAAATARRRSWSLRLRKKTWMERWNDDPRPFVWHKSADEILGSLAAYCQRINDSGH